MAHTYANLMYHGVFSTKNRVERLSPDLLPELITVIGGIVRQRDGKLLAMNGTANHVHLLSVLHPRHSISDMFRDIKAISCDWIHERFPAMHRLAWQEIRRPYGAWSRLPPGTQGCRPGLRAYPKTVKDGTET